MAAQETDQVEEAMPPYVQYYNDSGLNAHSQNGDEYATEQSESEIEEWIITHPWVSLD